MASRDESFKDFVLDQLQDLDGVDARRMFGGYGLYRDELSSASFTGESCILKLMDLRLANIASEK